MALDAPPGWVGLPVDRLAAEVGGRAAAVTRFGECRIPDRDTLVQADDVLHLAVPSEAVRGLEDLLQRGSSDA